MATRLSEVVASTDIGRWKEPCLEFVCSPGGLRAATPLPVSKLNPWSGPLTSLDPTSNPAALTPQDRME